MAISYKMFCVFDIFLIIFLVYIFVKYILLKKYRKLKYFLQEWKSFILGLYISYVVGLTLFPILLPAVGNRSYVINLDIMQIFQYESKKMLIMYILENMFLFFPFPILAEICGLKNFSKLHRTVLYTIVFSLIIEVLQSVEAVMGFTASPHCSNITDFVFNVIGAICGWLVYLIYKKYFNSHAEYMSA